MKWFAVARLIAVSMVLPVAASSTVVRADPVPERFVPTAQFQVEEIAGFTVRVTPEARRDPAAFERFRWRLAEQLQVIQLQLPPHHRAFLKSVNIWVDPSGTGYGLAHYLPLWYRTHASNWNPDQGGHIVVLSPDMFISAHNAGLRVMIHELAHAFHEQVAGRNNPAIRSAYEAARASGRYLEVFHSDTGRIRAGNASVNAEEYFSELTTAFFGVNIAQPRDRAELRTFDPQGYEMIREVWGVKD